MAIQKKTERDPFEVSLSDDETTELCLRLVREIDFAMQARDSIVGDDSKIDKSHEMYEGGDATLRKSWPWPNAANLGSFLVTEKVDALRARIVSTIFTDPIWVVDGWGAAAERAPFVEAFHQWKAEQEKLQSYLGRVIHNSLVEGTGVLEISDRVVLRRGQRKMNVAVAQDSITQAVQLNILGNPDPLRDNRGKLIEAGPNAPHVQMYVSDVVRATSGPSYRVHSLKNFFLLPGHASEKADLWGYAKRFWRQLPELMCRQRDGFYKHVDELTAATEREQSAAERRAGQDIAQAHDKTAEKEIWEITFLDDLDGDGYQEWYVATLSKLSRKLLRIQYEDYNTPHYVLFTPFPRPNSVYGYSLAWDKLGSLYDEHQAIRNMFADRSTLATSAPFLQVAGSPWNPAIRPFGPREVIPVRDLNELKQLEVRDVPNSVFQNLQMVLQAAERITGMNDLTIGVQASGDRTLGENKIATEQSFIRIDEAVKNFQEGLEDLFNIRHLIWINKLEDDPEQMPGELLQIMSERAIDLPNGEITADLLTGPFRGKPRGSVEASDLSRMRQDFVQMMTALMQLAQVIPAIAQHLSDPRVVRSLMTQIARIYRWVDRDSLVGGFSGLPSIPQPLPGLAPAPAGAAPPPQQIPGAVSGTNNQPQRRPPVV